MIVSIHPDKPQQRLVDKVVAFIAPAIIGGARAPSAVGGMGAERVAEALRLERVRVERLGEDLMVTGYPALSASPQRA